MKICNRLLSNEEKEAVVNDFVNKNYNEQTTCFMESQLHLKFKGTGLWDWLSLWFITYDEQKEIDKDVYLEIRSDDCEIKIKPHNAKKESGQRYDLIIDKNIFYRILKEIQVAYYNSKSRWSNEEHGDAFYKAFYEVLKNAKEIYYTEY